MRTRLAIAAAVSLALLAACGVAWAQEVVPGGVQIPADFGLSQVGGGVGLVAAVGVGIEKWITYRRGRDAIEEQRRADARLNDMIADHITRAMNAHRGEDVAIHHTMDLRLQSLEQARAAEAERWKEFKVEFGQLRQAVMEAVT